MSRLLSRISPQPTCALLVALLLLAACAPVTPAPVSPSPWPTTVQPTATRPAPTATLTATPHPSATTAPSPTVTPTPLPAVAARYQMTVDFSFDQKTASIQMQVDYTNLAPEDLHGLRVVIPPLAYPGAFTLKSLQWTGGETIAEPVWVENGLVVDTPAALPPGSRISLALAYDLAFPSAESLTGERPIPFAYTPRQVNFVDWYPFIPPYRVGEGWVVHPNSYYGESLVQEQADFDIRLRLSDARQDLVVAASAPAQVNETERHYQVSGSRSFALSISPEYQIATQTLGELTISSYYFPSHALAGRDAPQIIAEAVQLFQELFGPYPHATLALVEAEFLDGMEYDGLFFVSRGMYNLYTGTRGEYFPALTVHETAHQWWFASAGNDPATEPWLDEGFSTFSELLYYERYYPEAVQWWWDVRVNYYHPTGWVNSSVYDHIGLPGNYTLYRNAVYFNGAIFLNELRKSIGNEVFFAILYDYAQQNAGKIASAQNFFAVLAAHSSQDSAPLIKKFFK